MLIGHLAPAVFIKSRYARAPWALLVAAAYLPDLLEVAIRVAGVAELAAGQHSHSLPWLIAGSALVGIAALTLGHSRDVALAAASLVILHAPFDWITGRDKPLVWAYGPQVGLGVYSRPILDALVECGLCIAAWVALSRTAPRDARTLRVVTLAAVVAIQVSHNAYHGHRPFRRAVRRAIGTAVQQVRHIGGIHSLPSSGVAYKETLSRESETGT